MRKPAGVSMRRIGMSRVRGFFAGMVLGSGLVVAVPGAAHACSCVTAEPEDFVARADAVVWAEVTDVRVSTGGPGAAHYLLDVDAVYKGEVTERVRVHSAASGAACGLEGIRVREAYVFFLQRAAEGDGLVDLWRVPDGVWTADLCGGTGAVDQQQVERVVGAARPSGRDAGPAPAGEPAPGGPERLPLSGYSYAGMGVGALTSALVAAVLWRRRRSAAA